MNGLKGFVLLTATILFIASTAMANPPTGGTGTTIKRPCSVPAAGVLKKVISTYIKDSFAATPLTGVEKIKASVKLKRTAKAEPLAKTPAELLAPLTLTIGGTAGLTATLTGDVSSFSGGACSETFTLSVTISGTNTADGTKVSETSDLGTITLNGSYF